MTHKVIFCEVLNQVCSIKTLAQRDITKFWNQGDGLRTTAALIVSSLAE